MASLIMKDARSPLMRLLSTMRMKLVLGLIAITPILSGCVTTTVSAGTDVFCASAQPISWSINDTDQTIREVKAHNAVGIALCGWEV